MILAIYLLECLQFSRFLPKRTSSKRRIILSDVARSINQKRDYVTYPQAETSTSSRAEYVVMRSIDRVSRRRMNPPSQFAVRRSSKRRADVVESAGTWSDLHTYLTLW